MCMVLNTYNKKPTKIVWLSAWGKNIVKNVILLGLKTRYQKTTKNYILILNKYFALVGCRIIIICLLYRRIYSCTHKSRCYKKSNNQFEYLLLIRFRKTTRCSMFAVKPIFQIDSSFSYHII